MEQKSDNTMEEQDYEELGYGATSFTAIMKPVALTMALASFAVVNFRNAASSATQSGLSVYLVYASTTNDSAGVVFGKSALNALVIVSFMAVMTFVIVLCYKYRCMKLLTGYFMFSFSCLLGLTGGYVIETALQVYNVFISVPTFVFLMYNFAFTGLVAIFWQKVICASFEFALLFHVN